MGCGEQHFQGYINIDYPLTEHTVQATSGADVFADIAKITFATETVMRLDYIMFLNILIGLTAIALLCAWHMWLKPGGLLYIEVPDFLTSAKMMLDEQYPILKSK